MVFETVSRSAPRRFGTLQGTWSFSAHTAALWDIKTSVRSPGKALSRRSWRMARRGPTEELASFFSFWLIGFRFWRRTRCFTFTFTFTFLDIFVLLGPASASNQEEMLGSSEECILVDCRLDSGAVLIR